MRCAATAAKELGLLTAATRHSAVFENFHSALLGSVGANSAKVSDDYAEVGLALWPLTQLKYPLQVSLNR